MISEGDGNQRGGNDVVGVVKASSFWVVINCSEVSISGLRILSQTSYVEYIPKAAVRFGPSLVGNTKEVPGDKVAGETFCLTSAAETAIEP